MTLQIEDEQSISLPFDGEETARKVIEAGLDQEQCPYEASVSLTLTDNEGIRQMNQEFRQIDRATDVLSFPMTDFPAPAVFDWLETDGTDCFDPDTGELLLGDIVISVERAREQAEEYGHSLLREYAFLIAHSVLHLLGYDHMTPKEAEIMEEKQEQILTGLKIMRDK
ncbi:MAG: rRNA maturation RNase YbeY [Lachnospiraceae bacterium]|nr:rRNA maturation RNase YbeY [Lachnospiraceae bacterium]